MYFDLINRIFQVSFQKNLTILLCSMVDANLMVTTAQFIHEILIIYNLLTVTLDNDNGELENDW